MKVHSAEHPPDKSEEGIIRRCFQWVERRVVGNSDSAEYSEAWKLKFGHAPTWCDADMSLQQMNRGLAEGNRVALYSRAFFQNSLFRIGCVVQKYAWTTAILGMILYTMCCYGLKDVSIETDIVKLWVSQGGRLDEELNYLGQAQQQARALKAAKRTARAAGMPPPPPPGVAPVNATVNRPKPVADDDRRGPELPKENGLGGGFQVVIQTPKSDHEDVLSTESLLEHVKLMQEISKYSVHVHGENWTLADICFKPPGPSFQTGPLAKIMSNMLDKIIPCIWITPIDCYWEGAKPLGPYPPLNLGEEVTAFINSLPKGDVTWKNLNPTAVIQEVGQLFDLGPIGNFFERAGIGAAYLDRPCIDPLDPECPATAPNHFDRCAAFDAFNTWNMAKPEGEKINLRRDEWKKPEAKQSDLADNLLSDLFGKKRRKRAAGDEKEEKEEEGEEKTATAPTTAAPASAKTTKAPASSTQAASTTKKAVASTTKAPSSSKKEEKKDEDYYSYDDDYDASTIGNMSSTSKKEPENVMCLEYGKSLLEWMRANKNRWGEFLTEKQQPQFPNYGEVMTGGCRGFGKNIMQWPEDLIIGGVKREAQHVKSAEALQSVFLVASPVDVFLRYKEAKGDVHPNLNRKAWHPGMAQEVIMTWQRNFTKKLYGHEANHKKPGVRQFHPLASTSIADIMEEFSQFDFTIIFAGYGLMVVYAAFTQARFDGRWLAIQSNVMLSFIGVVLVTYSSICGLGLATMMGINFNAATTQIVPFLSLGLGIDDMFLLLHNYDEIINTINRNEMGVLLKETGMSVMVTSTNNILAFIAGLVLPIPALRSFCSQTAILLAFNLASLMFIFPAFIGLDLRRQRKGKRDLAYCCAGKEDLEVDMAMSVTVSNNMEARASYEAKLAEKKKKKLTAPHTEEEFVRNQPWYTVGGFLTNYYIPALKMPAVKAAVLFATLLMVVFGLYGMKTSTLGLELADVLPEHTPPAAFLRAREKYFSFYPMFSVLQGQTIDIPNQQKQIEEYRQALGKSDFMIKAEGKLQPYWMSLLQTWLLSLDEALQKEIDNGVLDAETGQVMKGQKMAPEAQIGQKLVCSYGTTYNCTGRLGHIKMVDADGIIRPEGFYNYLTGWFNVDNMMYYVSQASFVPNPPRWNPSKPGLVPAADPLLYSQIPYYQTGLTDTPVIVTMIEEIREICDQYTENGLANFPTGIAFTFWEQYLTLRWNLFLAICIIAFAVFTVITSLMFNPHAAGMVMVIVVVITIELGGFMGLFGVKMNPISGVTLICAVGIGVEFTAHVVLAFMTALGTIDDRLDACLQHMFVPVFHGAISTLLGIVMLVFSEFDFVVKYFFVVMSVLVLLGIFNGLTLLPVLLTLCGPPCELKPTDGSNHLEAPPPLRMQQASAEKGAESGLRKRRGPDVEMTSQQPALQPSAAQQHNYHDSLSTINEDK